MSNDKPPPPEPIPIRQGCPYSHLHCGGNGYCGYERGDAFCPGCDGHGWIPCTLDVQYLYRTATTQDGRMQCPLCHGSGWR